jgi:LysR family transcriptional regulator, glycine cleavage system transcriptional activator
MADDSPQATIDDPGLSWSQLRAFEACARLSSFAAAALSLSVTASAVRYQIGLLEARLGVALFERQGGRLALTKIGETFARQIKRPMCDLLNACATATQSALEAPITLSAPPLFAREFLLGGPFLAWCDANNVRLDVSDAKRELFGPTPIAVIRLGADEDADVTLTPLLTVALRIAAHPDIARNAQPADAAWWASQTLLCPSAAHNGWLAVWQALQLPDAIASRTVPYSSYAAAMEAACAGTGLILAPLPFAKKEFIEGRLLAVSDIRVETRIEYALITRNELAGSTRGRALKRRLIGICKREVAHAYA